MVLLLSLLPAGAGAAAAPDEPEERTTTVEIPETVRAELELELTPADEGVLRSDRVAGEIAFSAVSFQLPDGVDEVHVRSSPDGRTWSDWESIERVDPAEGPDPDSAADVSLDVSDQLWVDEAELLQVEVRSDTPSAVLTANLMDTVGLNGQPVREVEAPTASGAGPGQPGIVTREQWGADESIRGEPSYADGVDLVVVHHTAGSSSGDPAAIMRSIYAAHVHDRGFGDIGYNLVLAPDGQVYEGRYGGVEEAVVGAHAEGYNTGSFGVSVMGDYTSSHPTDAVYTSLAEVIAWKADVHDFDPEGTVTFNGEDLDVIVGHRDVGDTVCPGLIHDRLDQIAADAADRLEPGPEPFPDVPEDSVHREAVVALADQGIIAGYTDGTFRPDRAMSRGQTATALANALGLEASGTSTFSDVGADHPHHDGIHAVHQAGIVQGYADGTFRPQDDVYRDQMATFLANGFDLSGGPGSHFTDVPDENVHADAIDALYQAGVTEGCSSGANMYCPRDTLRRDQAASLLHRALD